MDIVEALYLGIAMTLAYKIDISEEGFAGPQWMAPRSLLGSTILAVLIAFWPILAIVAWIRML